MLTFRRDSKLAAQRRNETLASKATGQLLHPTAKENNVFPVEKKISRRSSRLWQKKPHRHFGILPDLAPVHMPSMLVGGTALG